VTGMAQPQEIEDEEYEQILDRVAAVDVAKAPGMVCTRVPHPSRQGRRRTLVWQVDATTNAILALADHLVAEGIEKVTLESASDCWRIWFYLLAAPFQCRITGLGCWARLVTPGARAVPVTGPA
jgi:transposase